MSKPRCKVNCIPSGERDHATFVLPGKKKLDEAALEPKESHVVWALGKCVADLKDPNTADKDRAVALCWLLHLVGDIHQPLHAAQLYSDQFPPPEGDRGGNFFFVSNSKHLPELYAYWDGLLGRDARYPAVDLAVEDLRHSGPFSQKALQNSLKKTGFADWAAESHSDARAFAYLGGRLKGVRTSGERRHEVEHVSPLTPEYEKTALQVAQRRAALAARRLRNQFQTLFGKGQANNAR